MTAQRQLHPHLQSVLDSLTDSQRRMLVRAAFEHDAGEDSAQEGWFTRLLDGLALQVAADVARLRAEEASVLAAHEADHRAYVEEVDRRIHGDPAPIVGVPATFDPETGEFRDGCR